MPHTLSLEPELLEPLPSYSPRTRLRSSTRPLDHLLSGNSICELSNRELTPGDVCPSWHPQQSADPGIDTANDLSPSFCHEDSRQKHVVEVNNSPVTPAGPGVQDHLKRRFASAFLAFFTLGWADGVTGTLLPHFEADLNLNYMSSSFFFVASASGYAIGTLLVEVVTRALGRFSLSRSGSMAPDPTLVSRFLSKITRKNVADRPVSGHSTSQSRFFTLVLAFTLHALFFAIMGSDRGFPSMLVAYVISAFSRSFVTATLNIYISSTPKKALGYIYGTWAVGAFCAPLVCQSVIATGIPWPRFYLGSLVVAALNLTVVISAFRPTANELRMETHAAREAIRSQQNACASPRASNEKTRSPTAESHDSSSLLIETTAPRGGLRRCIKMPYLWANSIFSCLYTGTESSTQGYIVLYLLSTRNANPNTVGYVTSGFWGGMALSRLMWGYASFRLSFTQRKWVVQACICMRSFVSVEMGKLIPVIVMAFSMHLLIWFVDSFIENAFSTAIVGMVYGPIYPSNLALANDLLPVDLHMVSMAVIAAFASIGAALFPFITGTISNIKGAHILPYITVAQTATMLCLWALFPSKLPRKEGSRQVLP